MAERPFTLTPDDAARAEAVLVEHGRFIEAVAYRHACSPDMVPDIVQQVRLQVCRSLSHFRAESHVRTWLYAVVRNEAITLRRTEGRREAAAERLGQLGEEAIDIEADAIVRDTFEWQRGVLDRAVDEQNPLRFKDGREVLSRRQREALRHIRAARGVSLDSSDTSALVRARERLRRWVALEGPHDVSEPDDE